MVKNRLFQSHFGVFLDACSDVRDGTGLPVSAGVYLSRFCQYSTPCHCYYFNDRSITQAIHALSHIHQRANLVKRKQAIMYCLKPLPLKSVRRAKSTMRKDTIFRTVREGGKATAEPMVGDMTYSTSPAWLPVEVIRSCNIFS